MPLYDYACTDCGRVIEVRHGFNESHADPCPACGSPMRRVFSAAPIVFKGSGFYLTDSRKAGAGSGSESKPAEAAKPAETASAPAPAPAKTSSEPAA